MHVHLLIKFKVAIVVAERRARPVVVIGDVVPRGACAALDGVARALVAVTPDCDGLPRTKARRA